MGGHSGYRALLSPREPGGASAAELHGDLCDNRVHRRALDVLLRGDADAAGHGSRRLDVRRHRSLHRPRGQWRPKCRGWASATTPTSAGRCRTHWQVFEGYCPPHYTDMRAAVEAFADRKFGPVGPSIPTRRVPGRRVPGCAQAQRFTARSSRSAWRSRRNTSTTASGSSPAPSQACSLTYLQAHHLDLEFYDHHFGPGAYLQTHAEHMSRWHPESSEG